MNQQQAIRLFSLSIPVLFSCGDQVFGTVAKRQTPKPQALAPVLGAGGLYLTKKYVTQYFLSLILVWFIGSSKTGASPAA